MQHEQQPPCAASVGGPRQVAARGRNRIPTHWICWSRIVRSTCSNATEIGPANKQYTTNPSATQRQTNGGNSGGGLTEYKTKQIKAFP
eukprot:4280734-Amphidinium_carterae.2